jgi:CheY-like chemotaxis protein
VNQPGDENGSRRRHDMSDRPAQLRALIAEDEILIAWQLQDILEGLGVIAAAIVATGEDAVKADISQIDIVLMDVNLAGTMSGIEAAQQIRGRCNVPFIFVTAYADFGVIDRDVDQIGRSAIVGKPATQVALRQAFGALGVHVA